MKLQLRDGLPLVVVSLSHRGREIELSDVLLDTGSASSVFAADRVLAIGLRYDPDDAVHRIRGVGGSEFVYAKKVDRISVGQLAQDDFAIEIGAMEYGLNLDGILGTDFLLQVGSIIDLAAMEIRSVAAERLAVE